MKRLILLTLLAICIPAAFIVANAADSHFNSQTNLEESFTEESQAELLLVEDSELQELGAFRPSFYWIALEKKESAPKKNKLLDRRGRVLAKVTDAFFKELKMEGTGLLRNKKLINFDTRVKLPDGTTQIRWRLCGPEAPFGYGYGNTPLKPFRSVAVDPTVVPLGTKLYIPAAKGVKLPDGTVHDGVFFADDIGSMIIDRKIDFFTSFGDQSKVFQEQGMPHGKMIQVFKIVEKN